MTRVDPEFRRMERLETALHRQAVATLLLLALVAVSGWWLTARDHSATDRNGDVADCRSVVLARTLDGYRVFVTPGYTQAEKDRASAALTRLGPLREAYEKCSTPD